MPSELRVDKVSSTTSPYDPVFSTTGGALSHRNMIINGAMQVAQRGTSFTTDNVYTLDRWKSGDGTGGTPARTLSQETFTLGQTDVVGFHKYLRHNQTGASTSGNSSLTTRIEDVTQFDGTTITVSFYAKADSAMTAQLRLIQNFGSGGSPSSDVEVNEDVSIGTSWNRYTVTKTLGSLSGKTLGTDGVHTSYLLVSFDLKPTTTFTFDITGVQLERGSVATPFEHRSYADELRSCERYYEAIGNFVGLSNNTPTSIDGVSSYRTTKRTTSYTVGTKGGANISVAHPSIAGLSATGVTAYHKYKNYFYGGLTVSNTGNPNQLVTIYLADDTLYVDDEL